MKYDIEALKRKMLVKYPFFGSVVANVNYKENRKIQTAGTDGETIYYNPTYLEGLSIEEQIFVLAHEVCHIAFNHILRSDGKDSELWNIATDAVINQFLKRDGLKLVSGVIDIEEAINYDAEELYNKLLQEKKQENQDQQQNSGSGQSGKEQQSPSRQQSSLNSGREQEQDKQAQEQSGSGSIDNPQEKEAPLKKDFGHDTHSMWEDAVKKHKEQLGKGNEKTELEKKQDESSKIGEKDAFNKNKEDRRKLLEELKEAISRQASQAGIQTNRDIIEVNDIGTSKPLIDWRYALRESINYEVDWSYKNATIEDGVVTANLEEQPMPETEIILDTSGSTINKVLLKNFLRECKNILLHSRLKVGCFDTEFYGFQEIRTDEDIENMKFVGGGGTDFNVAVNAFSRRVENKIIFTDGEASMPDMPLDAIWIVFGDKKINPKGGKVINITGEYLDRLYACEIIDDNEKITRNI